MRIHKKIQFLFINVPSEQPNVQLHKERKKQTNNNNKEAEKILQYKDLKIEI